MIATFKQIGERVVKHEGMRGLLHQAGHVAAVLVIVGLVYRARLLFVAGDAGGPSALYQSSHLLGDVLTASAVAALVLLLHLGPTLLVPSPGRGRQLVRLTGHVLALLLITTAALITQVNYALLVITGGGLTFDLMQEAVSAGASGLPGYGTAMEPLDAVLILSPALLYVGFFYLPSAPLRWFRRVLMTVSAAAVLLALLPLGSTALVAPEVRRNPVLHAALELLGGSPRADSLEIPAVPLPMYAQLRPPPSGRLPQAKMVAPSPGETAQRASVKLIHPWFATAPVSGKKKPPSSSTRWNVLMVIMESTGQSYPQDRRFGAVPMPFLQQLSRRSLVLANHYSSSNTSPHALFSLFTGLYPMPRPEIFVFKKGLRYPTLFSLLPAGYQSLLVTPGSLDYYYPREFMEHRGPREAFGRATLPGKRMAPRTNLAKHEAETTTFFLSRLERFGHRPFFAVYYSFAPHWPYPVYGYPYDRFPCEQKRFRSIKNKCRYFNNLHVLDLQIKRIHDHLRQRKLLDRTILLLVGDHGEAFGQHKKNWIHAHHSYNENVRVPAILHQPRLFKAGRVTRATTHVDLFPTLLDAMGLPYNPRLVQGESLFQAAFSRRYIFVYGKENTLSSISRDGVKLQIAYRRGKCWVYDLAQDPGETRRLGCSKYREQYRALRFYHQYQHSLLLGYNRDCKKGRPFHGQQHPAPAKLH